MQFFMGIEYTSNAPFFVCYSLIILAASFALTLSLNLLLNKKHTQFAVALFSLIYFAYMVDNGASKISNLSPISYIFYILSITFAIGIGMSAGLYIRRAVKHLAVSIRKKPTKNKKIVWAILLITLTALLYDVYYITTASEKTMAKNFKNTPYLQIRTLDLPKN